jgi:hypothetical protein
MNMFSEFAREDAYKKVAKEILELCETIRDEQYQVKMFCPNDILDRFEELAEELEDRSGE